MFGWEVCGMFAMSSWSVLLKIDVIFDAKKNHKKQQAKGSSIY